MNLRKEYYDIDGNACNILQLVKRDPEWAANRIQDGERAIAKLHEMKNFAATANSPCCPQCGTDVMALAQLIDRHLPTG
jgi:ribosomal protein S27AE